MITLGVIGLSEGNGHPYSFSAIINGYDKKEFDKLDWPIILDYLERQPKNSFGIENTKITHAWTQDAIITKKLCSACNIPNAVEHVTDMVGKVDAVIIARDDWQSHFSLAMPFLSFGTPVFIDKPLSLDAEEISEFRPYLTNGMLMSTSCFRYSKELRDAQKGLSALGTIKLINATVLNDVEKYGVHMLDALNGIGILKPLMICRLNLPHEAYLIALENNGSLVLNCLGKVAKTFSFGFFCKNGSVHIDISDNFSAFKYTLTQFVEMVKKARPPFEAEQVINTMKLIHVAKNLNCGQSVDINDVEYF